LSSAHGERIPLAKPVIGARERELVDAVLRSGQLSLGPIVTRFEEAWAQRIGVRHAVACSSGTAGLHCCLHALGVGPGDEVITSSFSFVASANAILFCGATPVFAEVDPLTFNMDPAAVEAAITPRTRAIEIVDIFGYPAEIPALVDIARRHGLGLV
jgi:perosamine synthetase